MLSLDVVCTATIMLFASRAVALRMESLHVVDVERFDLQYLLKKLVAILRVTLQLVHQRLILQVQVPIALEVLLGWIKLGQLDIRNAWKLSNNIGTTRCSSILKMILTVV